MQIINKRIVIFTALIVFGTTRCTISTNYNEGGHPPPDGWLRTVELDSNECFPIDGVYEVLGVGRLTKDEGLIQMRLDVALGHAFPTNEMPKHVSLSTDEQGTLLRYSFEHPVEEFLSISIDCSEGWYELERMLTDEYVGDGGVLDYSNRKIELRRTSDGNLIVHTILSTQFSSIGVIKSRYRREIWSKYEELKDQN